MHLKNDHYPDEHCLGDLSCEDFLNQYWQQKPLLIKNAFPNLDSPISAEELAGLACEEHVNSRIILNDSQKNTWRVEFGPFDEDYFSTLPETHWSLLVSDVERHLPQTKHLLRPFRFIPDWRIDDLMISYAPPGGSVGAHTDAYDVFLLQLSGQRLWKISEQFSKETLKDTELSILKEFEAEQEWLLNAGDMLYLPPNVAHHGIAQDTANEKAGENHCLTASIGFRAPSINTIVNDFIHFQQENNQEEKRYRDASPVTPKHHAEITDETITEFTNHIRNALKIDYQQVKQWLGQYCSDNKTFEDFTDEDNDIDFSQLSIIAEQSNLMLSPYSNFLFSHEGESSHLFVNGISYKTSPAFAESLCQESDIDFKKITRTISDTDKDILTTLFNNGSIIIA